MLRLRSRCPSTGLGTCSVAYRLAVPPQRADRPCAPSSGNVRIANFRGSARIDTASGDVDVAGFCGFLAARPRADRRRRARARRARPSGSSCARARATCSARVPPGRYRLDADSDDGARRVRGLRGGRRRAVPDPGAEHARATSTVEGAAVSEPLELGRRIREAGRSARLPRRRPAARRPRGARASLALAARRRAERRAGSGCRCCSPRRGRVPAGSPTPTAALANRCLGTHIPPRLPPRRRRRGSARSARSPTASCGACSCCWRPSSSSPSRCSSAAGVLHRARRLAARRLGLQGHRRARRRSTSVGPLSLGVPAGRAAVPARGARGRPRDRGARRRWHGAAAGDRRARCSPRRAAPAGPVREMLAESLGDRTLSIAYWLPDREVFVDERAAPSRCPSPAPAGRGRRSSATAAGSRRSSTTPALDTGPELVNAAAAAAVAGDRQRAPEGRPARAGGGAARVARCASSRRPTPRAGASSATSTTAPSSSSSRLALDLRSCARASATPDAAPLVDELGDEARRRARRAARARPRHPSGDPHRRAGSRRRSRRSPTARRVPVEIASRARGAPRPRRSRRPRTSSSPRR